MSDSFCQDRLSALHLKVVKLLPSLGKLLSDYLGGALCGYMYIHFRLLKLIHISFLLLTPAADVNDRHVKLLLANLIHALVHIACSNQQAYQYVTSWRQNICNLAMPLTHVSAHSS